MSIAVSYRRGPVTYTTKTGSGGQVDFTFTVAADRPTGDVVAVKVTIGSGTTQAACSTSFRDDV